MLRSICLGGWNSEWRHIRVERVSVYGSRQQVGKWQKMATELCKNMLQIQTVIIYTNKYCYK